jgi:Tyrosine phosphatase family
VTEPRTAGLLPVAEAVDPELPWLWWATSGSSRLAGMSAPPEGFPFSVLPEQGLDTIVSLIGPPSYDPSPLSSYAFTLQDLARGATPEDSAAEEIEVRRAVTAVRSLLADGRSVAVHCRAGIGRTGLVIGAVLVSAGHDPTAVTAWVDQVQRARGASGWPESPWQAALLASYLS